MLEQYGEQRTIRILRTVGKLSHAREPKHLRVPCRQRLVKSLPGDQAPDELDAAVGLDVVVPPGRRGRPRGDPRSGLRGASGLPDTTGGFHGNANLEPYRIIGPDGPLAADLDAIRFFT